MPEPLPATDPLAPEDSNRLIALDIIRGFAVLGIVIPNIISLGQPMIAYSWPGGFLVPPGPLAEWLWGAQLVLVDGKFRGLFTLLFGAGLVLFLRRAEARGHGLALLARRLGWLGLFGFLHWALLWRGDILMSYASAGFVVLAFLRWDWTRQLALGLIGYAIGAIASMGASIPMARAAQGSFPPGSARASVQDALADFKVADLADARAETALIVAGDFGGAVHHALAHHLADLPGNTVTALFETVPLMLIGMALMGAGAFEVRGVGRAMKVKAAALWLAGTAASVPIALLAMAGGITYWDSMAAISGWLTLPQLASTLGLLGLLLAWSSSAEGPLARRLRDAGRCAFTNYIGTSALALALFSGWGLGLFGTLGRLELYALVPAFWAIMLAWPRLWLARFRHGPLEWLWRCLTYGRWLPLRR